MTDETSGSYVAEGLSLMESHSSVIRSLGELEPKLDTLLVAMRRLLLAASNGEVWWEPKKNHSS